MNQSRNVSGATELPKVVLRAMEPEDLEWLYAMENDREVWHIGNTNVPYSRYVLHDYIANSTNDIYHDGQVRMIVENEAREQIGMVDVFDFNAQHRRAEVSIVVQKKHRRKGYAAAAIARIADYSLRVLHLHPLYAVVAEDNEASLALFFSQGFQTHNRLKEWLFDGVEYADAIVLQKIL